MYPMKDTAVACFLGVRVCLTKKKKKMTLCEPSKLLIFFYFCSESNTLQGFVLLHVSDAGFFYDVSSPGISK